MSFTRAAIFRVRGRRRTGRGCVRNRTGGALRMLWRYNETSLREIDVLNATARLPLTAVAAEGCFAPIAAVAAQRKSQESIHIYFTHAPIFRADGPSPAAPVYAEANPCGFALMEVGGGCGLPRHPLGDAPGGA